MNVTKYKEGYLIYVTPEELDDLHEGVSQNINNACTDE